jgi:hypothetical protein
MKNTRTTNENKNVKFNTHKRRPENKDDIDSRKAEEQLFKGTDTTHNRKEKESDRKKVGGDKR